MSFTGVDARYMARALQLARRGLYTTDPNPRVGCVIAKHGQIVGEGWHLRAGEPHAEALALRAAGADARGADVYVTLEPCCHQGRTPPCTDGLIRAGIKRVVAAMSDPNPLVSGKGAAALNAAGIETAIGLMQPSAEALNPGFIARMRRGRPLVRVKIAASLDGRTALRDGASKWITGDAARRDGQRWRARSSAIVTGSGTVLADDPALTVRDVDIGRTPLRVVVDSALRTPPNARMLRLAGPIWIATVGADAARERALTQAGARIVRLPSLDGRVDLAALMGHLAQAGANEVLVEAGAGLAGALLQAGVVDELLLYVATHALGDTARGMFQLPALATLAERAEFDVIDVRAIGADWRVQARVRTMGAT